MTKRKLTREEVISDIVSYVEKHEERILYYMENKKIIDDARNNKVKDKKSLSARSKRYWQIRGFNDLDCEIIRNSRMPGRYEYYRLYKGLSKEDSIESCLNYRTNILTITEESFIKKHGEDEGRKKWKSYCERQRYTNTYEYKNKKYGWTEEEYCRYNKSRAVTEESLIKKHGEDEGRKKWKSYCERQRYTNTLEYYKEVYGDVDGEKKYNLCNFLKGHSFESYMYKYKDEKVAIEKYNSFLNSFKNYSDISVEMFKKIHMFLPVNSKCFYSTYNYERIVTCKFNKRFSVDFYYEYNNKIKIMEFFGDYWHCSNNLFEDENVLLPSFFVFKTPKDVRENDAERVELLKQMYGNDNVIVIWEGEYIMDKDYVVSKCLKFLEI